MKGYYLKGSMYHINDNIGRDAKQKAKKGIKVYPVAPSEGNLLREGEAYFFMINKQLQAIKIRKIEE
jgi:hypothetical protein